MKTISYSEMETFSSCRQKHFWSYKEGLSPKGVQAALDFGSAGHAALEAYYTQQDWRKALQTWKDAHITHFIENALPQSEEDDEGVELEGVSVESIVAIAEQVVDRYILKYGAEDKYWTVLEVEKKFHIPIPNTDYILTGVWDLLIQDAEGRTWLVDHKFPVSAFRDDQALELDAQIGIYQWAAREYGHDTIGFIYNQILAKLPALPKVLATKNKLNGGKISTSELYTDWETFAQFVTDNGEKPEDYWSGMYPKLSGKRFYDRRYVYRHQTEIENFGKQLQTRIRDMERITPDLVYMEPSKYGCNYCPFKGLCLATLRGEPLAPLVEEGFNQKSG